MIQKLTKLIQELALNDILDTVTFLLFTLVRLKVNPIFYWWIFSPLSLLAHFNFQLDVCHCKFSKTRNIFLDIIYVEVILTG